MDKTYLERRTRKGNYTNYRLEERAGVITSLLDGFIKGGINSVLDIGTADGIMLNKLAGYFNIKNTVGIDLSEEALRIANHMGGIKVSSGDFTDLPFKEETFDLVLASAVLEHVQDTGRALDESYRVLKKKGILCVTLPNPFYDWINSKLVKTYHLRRYGLKKTKSLMEKHGFKILKAYHFMLWPFGRVPFSGIILRFIRFLRLDFLLFNHITLALKA